jgi:hypothetical protein
MRIMTYRNKLNSILIAFCSLFMLSSGNTQESIWTFTYDVAFPLGETADYIDRTSWRGFTVQGRHFINSNISIGGSFSWQVFNQRLSELVEFSFEPANSDQTVNGTLSGEQFRYINTLPIMFNAYYYLGDPLPSAIRPYAGLSVGTAPTKRRTEIGLLAIDDFNWHFAFAPEAGILIPIGTNIDFIGAVRYNVALKANDSINYSHFNINVGLANIF